MNTHVKQVNKNLNNKNSNVHINKLVLKVNEMCLEESNKLRKFMCDTHLIIFFTYIYLLCQDF